MSGVTGLNNYGTTQLFNINRLLNITITSLLCTNLFSFILCKHERCSELNKMAWLKSSYAWKRSEFGELLES